MRNQTSALTFLSLILTASALNLAFADEVKSLKDFPYTVACERVASDSVLGSGPKEFTQIVSGADRDYDRPILVEKIASDIPGWFDRGMVYDIVGTAMPVRGVFEIMGIARAAFPGGGQMKLLLTTNLYDQSSVLKLIISTFDESKGAAAEHAMQIQLKCKINQVD
jgi:hypothetical protein